MMSKATKLTWNCRGTSCATSGKRSLVQTQDEAC